MTCDSLSNCFGTAQDSNVHHRLNNFHLASTTLSPSGEGL